MAIRDIVRQAITTAKRQRKYCVPGPYAPIETTLWEALLEVERLAKQETEPDYAPRQSALSGEKLSKALR